MGQLRHGLPDTADSSAAAGTAAADRQHQRRPDPPQHPPALGAGGMLRFLWRQLTSMRTGSLLPQRGVAPIRVKDFLAAHPRLGPVYDTLGLFAVYTSPWFSAIYLLLLVSLIGCILPRLRSYARALQTPPPKTPRNLDRLPVYAAAELSGMDPTVLDRATDQLRRRRYRLRRDGNAVAAERGYLREAGNLVFHLSVVVLLLGVTVNALLQFRGDVVVVTGQGFSNNLTQFDDVTAGAWFSEARMPPFTVAVDRFDAAFEMGPVQRGAARLFRADLQVVDRPGAAPRPVRLEVNRPLIVADTKVHLIGHGYAPQVTVTDGAGKVAFAGPVVFLPQDGNFTSAGVIKVPDGRPDRLAFQAIFVPTSAAGQPPRSLFPDALVPALYLNAFAGPPRAETGVPESVYALNQTGLTQLRNTDGTAVAVRLEPGERFVLPDGEGSIRFDGWTRWVKLQVSSTPGLPLVIGAIAAAIAGLWLSLFVRPRRVWVRLVAVGDGARLDIGGLDRAGARTGLAADVQQLLDQLTTTPPDAVPDPRKDNP
jgi:cytochrome c biogenesis protein